MLIFGIFYVFCYILHIPKCCAPGLTAAGRQGVKLHIPHFFHILYFFAYKNRGGSYSAHILHICCILVILKQGGSDAQGGLIISTWYANGDFIFCIFNTCFIFDKFSVLYIFAIFNIFYIFCIFRIFFNPFWQMVCRGFKLSDEDEDQGQTYMSRQWLSRSPHVGASAASSSSCGIIRICLICCNIWFWKESSFRTMMSCRMNRMDACQSTSILGSCTNIKKYAKYAKYVSKYAIKHADKHATNMSNMQLHLRISRICE